MSKNSRCSLQILLWLCLCHCAATTLLANISIVGRVKVFWKAHDGTYWHDPSKKEIIIKSDRGLVLKTKSDEQGCFLIEDAAPGSYRFLALKGNYNYSTPADGHWCAVIPPELTENKEVVLPWSRNFFLRPLAVYFKDGPQAKYSKIKVERQSLTVLVDLLKKRANEDSFNRLLTIELLDRNIQEMLEKHGDQVRALAQHDWLIKTYEERVKNWPSFFNNYYVLARLLFFRNDFARVKEVILKSLSSFSMKGHTELLRESVARFCKEVAEKLEESGKNVGLDFFIKVLNPLPKGWNVRCEVAEFLIERKRTEEAALILLSKGKDAIPRAFFHRAGILLSKTKELEKARELLNCCEEKARDFIFWRSLANASKGLGDDNRAATEYLEAIKVSSEVKLAVPILDDDTFWTKREQDLAKLEVIAIDRGSKELAEKLVALYEKMELSRKATIFHRRFDESLSSFDGF